MSARDEQPATVPPPPGEDDAYSAATKVGAMPAEVMAKLRAEGLLPDEEEVAAPPPRSARPATNLAPRPGLPPQASQEPPSGPTGPVPMLYSTAPPANTSPPPPGFPPSPHPPGLDSFQIDEDEKTVMGMELPIPDAARRGGHDGSAPPLPTIRLETPSAEIQPTPTPQQLATPLAQPSPFTPPMPPMHVHHTGTSPMEFAVASVPPSQRTTAPPVSSAPPQEMAASQHVSAGPMAVIQEQPPLAPPDQSIESATRAFGGGGRKKSQILFVFIGLAVLLVSVLFAMALLSQRR